MGYEHEYTRSWGEAMKEAKKYTFVQKLQLINHTDMKNWQNKALETYTNNYAFDYHIVRQHNKAVGILCQWVQELQR